MAGNVTKFKQKEGETRDGKMPSKETLLVHEKAFLKTKGEISELSGDLGALCKNAANDHNIHKKAFKLIQQCKRMDDVKRSAFLAHFDSYRDVFAIDNQLDLPLGDVAAQAAE